MRDEVIRFTAEDIKEVTNKKTAYTMINAMAQRINYIVKPRRKDFNVTRWYDLYEAINYFSKDLPPQYARHQKSRERYRQILHKIKENLDY